MLRSPPIQNHPVAALTTGFWFSIHVCERVVSQRLAPTLGHHQQHHVQCIINGCGSIVTRESDARAEPRVLRAATIHSSALIPDVHNRYLR